MARFLEAGTPLGEDLVLLRMAGREELGRLSEFQLVFTSRRGDIAAEEILGKNITWSLDLGGGKRRYFNGFVTSFGEAGESTVSGSATRRPSYFYEAVVHPGLWFLTRASACRVFEEMKVTDALNQVLQKYSFVTAKLPGRCSKRPYIVQYRETDFNFVCRSLEHEGFYFLFEHEDGKHTFVVRDGEERPGETIQATFDAESRSSDKDHLTAWRVKREIQAGRYALADFDYKKPRVQQFALEQVARPCDLSGYAMYDYPGEYAGSEDGPRYAKARIQELQVGYEQFAGSGNLRQCAPGKLLKLTGQPPRPQYNNAEYLITAVSHTASAGDLASGGGGDGDYHCTLTAIDAKTAFRPARLTPKPIVQGLQTAIVSDRTDPDHLGRVRVKFHWGGDGDCQSCWVRVAQPLAGNGWGFLGIPHIGHEVVVAFLEGDPDQPLVTGSVYNGDNKLPYGGGGELTRTGLKSLTSNPNELRFEDKDGGEELYIHAQKDKTVRIENDRTEWVGNESHLIVKKAAYEKRDADHHITLAGNRNEKLDGSLSMKVGQDVLGKVGNKLAYDAGMEIHLKAGMKLVLEAGVALDLKVGGNFVSINPGGVFIKGAMVMINSGGSAGSGSGASPTAATAPKEAAQTEGGKASELASQRTVVAAYSPTAQGFRMAAATGAPAVAVS